jgi:hypothetical protein
MKKAFLLSAFFCICFCGASFAQTNSTTTGTPVSASRDVVVTGSATIQQPDSTGTPASTGKDARGPLISAPADNKQSTGSDKASSDKKPQ